MTAMFSNNPSSQLSDGFNMGFGSKFFDSFTLSYKPYSITGFEISPDLLPEAILPALG